MLICCNCTLWMYLSVLKIDICKSRCHLTIGLLSFDVNIFFQNKPLKIYLMSHILEMRWLTYMLVQLFKWGVGYQRHWSTEQLWAVLVSWLSVMFVWRVSLRTSLFMLPKLRSSHLSCQISTSTRMASKLSCIKNSLNHQLSFHWSKEVKRVQNVVFKMSSWVIFGLFVLLCIFQNYVWNYEDPKVLAQVTAKKFQILTHLLLRTRELLNFLHVLDVYTFCCRLYCTTVVGFSYIASLLNEHRPTRTLRSSDELLFTIPFCKLSLGNRAFSIYAPRVWNSMTHDCRASSSIACFKSNLKDWTV